MNWLSKLKSGIQTLVRRRMPDNLWIKCERCHQTVYRKQLEQNFGICNHCGHHFRIPSHDYLSAILDEASFEEIASGVIGVDVLNFVDRVPYKDRLKDFRKRTGLGAAVLTGLGRINGTPVGVGIHEMAFIGGSLGSAEGERICQLIERCLVDRLALILVCRSGGARMQESILSLMQMAKVNTKLSQFSDAGLLYVAVLIDPTTAGVSASYASVGDITIAEPNALIGFTGERITGSSVGSDEMEALRQAQRAEKVLEHGFVDMIVPRQDMKATLSRILGMLCVRQRLLTEGTQTGGNS
ncbi:MAG: acetyl-CoA carboxylase, carboxyltransferase subunit beta [bacterium]|jgi:acetyl-CoA carboxylase carboxyl transferase subunit beta|nr:acetyl-CoA carboxylase, carboxyltransferase subunit beta [bacterium]